MICALRLRAIQVKTVGRTKVSDPDDTLLLADELVRSFDDASEVDRVVGSIKVANRESGWTQSTEIKVGKKRWRPSAVSKSGASILYVSLRGDIPSYVSSRLNQAFSDGLQVCIALPLTALFNPDILELLAKIDASVIVINEIRTVSLRPLHFMAAMADLGVPVEPQLRVKLATTVWNRIRSGSPQERGKRLEALLAFLFSQVADLRVVERNYRNETQEIDLVLQVDNFSSRIWQRSGPLMLVEAKNTSEATQQNVVSLLIHKIRTKRGVSRVGLLVSIAGFTDGAEMEELRISESDNCVVLIDEAKLLRLIEAVDLDEVLETLVRRAMLR